MHEIDFSNGRANMAYVGEVPWHGLGQQVDDDMTIEQWRVAAGLDWEALAAMPFFYPGGPTEAPAPITNKRVIYRSDTGAPLSVMGDGYQIVQPAEVLEFYRDLIEQYGFKMDTAGSLKEGKKIWALAKVGEGFSIMGQDTILPYCLLATSFDGSLATTAQLTSIRVVCQNTLSLSINEEKQNAVKINHSSKFNERDVKYQLGLFQSGWTLFEHQANELARREVSPEEALNFMLTVTGTELHEGETLSDIMNSRGNRNFKKLLDVTQTGVGQNTRSAVNTAWGLVNGVTRMIDHESGSRNADNRINSAWFGMGNIMKRKAFHEALKLAEIAA